jgi:hypothetical protein
LPTDSQVSIRRLIYEYVRLALNSWLSCMAEPRLFVEQQAGCDVLSSSAAVVKQWMVDLGRRLHGRDPAAGGGPVVAAPEAALGDKVTSVVGESQEADEQADGPLEETGTNWRGD